MPTQKRTSRSSSKKPARSASARKRTGLKSPQPRRRRAASATKSTRKPGVIKRAIKKGISELAKVGS